MLQTKCVVVDVVRRSNLQTARTELNVHIRVFYDRNATPHQWYNDMQSFQPSILHVVGIDAHSGVAHNGFRTCGSYNSVVTLVVFVHHIVVVLAFNLALVFGCNIVFKVVEL